jgi:YHS domain-containing protein
MKHSILLIILTFSLNSAFAQKEVFTKSDEAIQGYDPVAYFKEGKPMKGKKEFSFLWNEATWIFASRENLAAFKIDPEKYAPQFGGYCAYGISEGHKAPTSPDAWTIVDGKLYLNYNKNVRSLWNEKQSDHIANANKNWPKIKLEKDE